MIFDQKRLAELMRDKGITPADFSRMTGMCPRYLERLVRGKKSPLFDTVVKVSQAFGVPLQEFVNQESS